MDDPRTPMDPREAEDRFAAMLAEAGLPRFTSALHDAAANELQLGWDNGFTLHVDLTRHEWDPIDDWEREAILSGPVHVTIPSAAEDPRGEMSRSAPHAPGSNGVHRW